MIEILMNSFDFTEIEPPESILPGEQEKKLCTELITNYKPSPWIIMAASFGNFYTVNKIWNLFELKKPKLLKCIGHIGLSPIRKNFIVGNCFAAAM